MPPPKQPPYATGAYPQAALQRFTDNLNTTENPELKRFNELNRSRVQEFIRKPFDDIPKFHAASHPKETKPTREGFYNYDSLTDHTKVSVQSSCPEFQRSLGNRSRFGDGDGSFWDKWVNAETPSKGLGLDEHGLPVKGQLTAPTTGFKRLYMNRSLGRVIAPVARTKVEPYSVRRERRLQKELEEKETAGGEPSAAGSQDEKSSLPDYSSPSLQKKPKRSPGKTMSPVKEDWEAVDVFEVNESGELLFNDSPVSLPALSQLEMSSYFGSRARYEFLDIFRQLSRQRYNFRDNKFMAFDSVIDELEDLSAARAPHKPKLKKYGTARFSSLERVDMVARKSEPPSPSKRPRSSAKRLGRHFQRKMSTMEDPLEVTEEIESDVANVHLTLPKEGPAKFARPLSPRHRFILGCINSKITPRPSLLIRKDLSTLLNLEHQNMGDRGGILLANALDGLPHLCSLNIADNNLTDSGLTAIIKKLPLCPLLTSLDVSENKIDAEAAHELSSYLLSPSCALIDIIMRKSDVDDNEIGSFVQAIGHSKKLINVDLSGNLIGSNQRKLQTNLTMGGKVLGEMLCAKSCKIRTLKLAWNMIRFDSGVELLQSLKENNSLTYLDVSYNGLGDDGAQSFGDAIQVNSTLQTVLLSNNNITSVGCFCVIEGIKKCPSLVNIDLTNNPIGERGAISVMTAISDIGDKVKIDIRGCSIARKDDICWYELENPIGKHTLHLSKQYDRAVTIDMLKQCAQSNGTFVLESISYTPDPKHDTRGTQSMTLTHRQGGNFIVNEKKKMPPQVILDLYEKYCSDGHVQLFEKIDSVCDEVIKDYNKTKKEKNNVQLIEFLESLKLDPQSTCRHFITKNMTSEILFRLGFGNYDWLCNQIFSVFDVLGLKYIEVNQLKEFFSCHLSQYLSMWEDVVRSGHGDCYFEYENEEYVPTDMGTLSMDVKRCDDNSSVKSVSTVQRILTLENINNILSSLKRTDASYRMCEYALTGASLLFDEALLIYRFMLNEVGEKNIVLSRLLPIMPNYFDARQLIDISLGNDVPGRVTLRQVMGPSYRVITGSPTGFYTLHLSKEVDRSCLRRLFDYSNSIIKHRIIEQKLGDTSQHGNGYGFRNAVLDGSPVIITKEWGACLPDKGKLEFDFVYAMKSSHMEPMSDIRFKKLLAALTLFPEDDEDSTEDDDDDEDDDESIDDTPVHDLLPMNGHMSEAEAVSDFIKWCDENKASRTTISFPLQLNTSTSRFDMGNMKLKSNFNKRVSETEDKEMQRQKSFKAEREKIFTVEYMVEAIGNGSISCDQVATLFEKYDSADELFAMSDIFKKPYGTLKVEVLINVYNQICDPAKINKILKGFSPYDRAALIFRMGILNIWSSLCPDGFYILDLSKKDERLVLCILITLSVAGSQKEFSDVVFRSNPHSKSTTEEDEEAVVNFPSTWKSERNVPVEGIIQFHFVSEEDVNNENRQLPDSLHSEMLSLLYAPPLLTESPNGVFTSRRGLEINHSVKKTSILASNVGVKFNFDISTKMKLPEQEVENS